MIDILVQSRRNRRAAARSFRKLLKGKGREPRRLITDTLGSYSAAHRTAMLSAVHSTRQYENNRAEVSHQPTRHRERQMRRFKSARHVQRFVSVHGVVLHLFRIGRHLLQAVHHRLLRARSFRLWDEVTIERQLCAPLAHLTVPLEQISRRRRLRPPHLLQQAVEIE